MHSLETIHRLNAEALQKSAKHFADQGRFVVVTYFGLHVASVETFSDQDDAFAALNAPLASPDVNRKLIPPTPREQVVGQRDQSEDRVANEQTLAGYIERTQRAEGLAPVDFTVEPRANGDFSTNNTAS